MALQILRMALVRETIETEPQDSLRLLDGAPDGWFEPGKRVTVKNAPTFFGKISFDTEASAGRIDAHVTKPAGFSAREIILRLPDPSGRPLRRVLINGTEWKDFAGNEVRLPPGEQLTVRAEF
ncbi:MAG: hypothetical protein JO022_06175 [Acidobacteriaceae bacterium]|nr:hypothetical protein [Acidobacteriaceae bacterium]